jgi:hypothetical protein
MKLDHETFVRARDAYNDVARSEGQRGPGLNYSAFKAALKEIEADAAEPLVSMEGEYADRHDASWLKRALGILADDQVGGVTGMRQAAHAALLDPRGFVEAWSGGSWASVDGILARAQGRPVVVYRDRADLGTLAPGNDRGRMNQDPPSPSREMVLEEALRRLYAACLEADADEELPPHIDGSLLDDMGRVLGHQIDPPSGDLFKPGSAP